MYSNIYVYETTSFWISNFNTSAFNCATYLRSQRDARPRVAWSFYGEEKRRTFVIRIIRAPLRICPDLESCLRKFDRTPSTNQRGPYGRKRKNKEFDIEEKLFHTISSPQIRQRKISPVFISEGSSNEASGMVIGIPHFSRGRYFLCSRRGKFEE